ncbi:MAG: cytochrome c biogenesis CcdA family protein [Actinomycetota bacterium]
MLADLVRHGLSAWWAPGLAFAAGVLSFASPCVYPLVPGYLAFVTGAQGERPKPSPLPILLFILGFTVVFTVLGATAGAFRQWILSDVGQRAAGAVIVAFGILMVLYGLRVGWLGFYAERRPFLSRVRPGPAGAVPLGMAFAAGWTPCIGPVLGGIFTIAASGGSLKGGFLLFVYSLGLGLPFLLIGLGVGRMLGALEWVKRNYRWIAGVSGVLMVAIGVLLLTGTWIRLLNPFLRWGNRIDLPI